MTSTPDAANSFFGLVWPGKEHARQEASAPLNKSFHPGAVLGDQARLNDAPSNRFYIGDNLDVLKQLVDEGFCADVIYIDPPYNTGKSFTYRDNYRARRKGPAGDYGQWHAQWLSMMLPRLILAKQVLADTGFIFISIGEDEAANVRKVADEVFGEHCYAGQFIWKKAGTGKNDSKYAIIEHEYVLVYAGSPQNPGFLPGRSARTTTNYNYEDEHGRYSLVRLDSKTLGYLPTLDFPIADPDGREYWPHQPAGHDKVARWRWGKEKVEKNYDQLVFRRGFVYTKNYEKIGARPRSILDGERFGVTRTGRKDAEDAVGVSGVFDFPKPVRLIKHLISIAAGPGAVVLDFFAGSGTTAQAVAELNAEDDGNRTFCLVQLPEPTESRSTAARAGYESIAEICQARIAAVTDAPVQVFNT